MNIIYKQKKQNIKIIKISKLNGLFTNWVNQVNFKKLKNNLTLFLGYKKNYLTEKISETIFRTENNFFTHILQVNKQCTKEELVDLII